MMMMRRVVVVVVVVLIVVVAAVVIVLLVVTAANIYCLSNLILLGRFDTCLYSVDENLKLIKVICLS